MFERITTLTSSTAENVRTHLETLNSNLIPDISNYAPGRKRFWIQTEFPLSLKYQSFRAGVQDPKLWGWLQQVWQKSGLEGQPETALAIYGDVPIQFHGDAPCAAKNAIQINLGGTTFVHDSSPPVRGQRNKPSSPIEHTLDMGEVSRFNCKHLHATVEPEPDRWSIIVWQISQFGRSAYQQYLNQQ